MKTWPLTKTFTAFILTVIFIISAFLHALLKLCTIKWFKVNCPDLRFWWIYSVMVNKIPYYWLLDRSVKIIWKRWKDLVSNIMGIIVYGRKKFDRSKSFSFHKTHIISPFLQGDSRNAAGSEILIIWQSSFASSCHAKLPCVIFHLRINSLSIIQSCTVIYHCPTFANLTLRLKLSQTDIDVKWLWCPLCLLLYKSINWMATYARCEIHSMHKNSEKR